MKTVCNENLCAGCMLCAEICPVEAITIEKHLMAYNAFIDSEKCIHCGLCYKHCMQKNTPMYAKPFEWFQGWSNDEVVRAGSSSGGLAAEISRSFIRHGGEVLTCCFEQGDFIFKFFSDLNELISAAGSKYVKSNPYGIYKALLNKIKSGKKVLMIGLPCQVAAAKEYVQNHENFYGIDLICHGTPSPEVLRLYLKSNHIELDDIKDIQFRFKGGFGLRNGYKAIDEKRMDAYSYAFMGALTYTENCYYCKYSKLARVGDITLGDSWGSELDSIEQKKGISLILCQTKKGQDLLEICNLELKQVDIKKAIAANGNLSEPSVAPKGRKRFLREIDNGKDFESMVNKAYPLRIVKNFIKGRILKISGGG